MYSYYIHEVLSENLEGFYFDLLDDISKQNKLKLEISPFKRSLRNFKKAGDGCIFPIDISIFSEEEKESLIHSREIISSPIHFFKFDKSTINNENVNVAINQSIYHYIKDKMPSNLAYVNIVNTDKQLVEMLARKRVDLVIGIYPDLHTMFKDSDYHKTKKLVLHGKELLSIRDMIVCKKSDKNQKIIEKFNDFILNDY